MPDERHVLSVLDAHDAQEGSVLCISPECDAGIDLMVKIFPGPVRILPAVSGYHVFSDVPRFAQNASTPGHIRTSHLTAKQTAHADVPDRKGLRYP